MRGPARRGTSAGPDAADADRHAGAAAVHEGEGVECAAGETVIRSTIGSG